MSKGGQTGRKGHRIVRTPATRFAHIQKRMRKLAIQKKRK